MNYKKIDMHAHFITPSYRSFSAQRFGPKPEGYPTPEWSIKAHLAQMDATGVDYTLLSTANPYPYTGENAGTLELVKACNDEISEMCAEHSSRFGFTAVLPLHDVQSACREACRALSKLGALGVCISSNVDGLYLGHPDLDPLMDALNQLEALVLLHPTAPGSIPANVNEHLPIPALEFFCDTTRVVTSLVMEDVFERFPRIRWVVPHAGAFLPILADRIDQFPNLTTRRGRRPDMNGCLNRCYFDAAGYPEHTQLPLLLQMAQADHIFYGSDFPYVNAASGASLAQVLEETDKLNHTQKLDIFYNNAARLLGRN